MPILVIGTIIGWSVFSVIKPAIMEKLGEPTILSTITWILIVFLYYVGIIPALAICVTEGIIEIIKYCTDSPADDSRKERKVKKKRH